MRMRLAAIDNVGFKRVANIFSEKKIKQQNNVKSTITKGSGGNSQRHQPRRG
jgi:hypothetical protein